MDTHVIFHGGRAPDSSARVAAAAAGGGDSARRRGRASLIRPQLSARFKARVPLRGALRVERRNRGLWGRRCAVWNDDHHGPDHDPAGSDYHTGAAYHDERPAGDDNDHRAHNDHRPQRPSGPQRPPGRRSRRGRPRATGAPTTSTRWTATTRGSRLVSGSWPGGPSPIWRRWSCGRATPSFSSGDAPGRGSRSSGGAGLGTSPGPKTSRSRWVPTGTGTSLCSRLGGKRWTSGSSAWRPTTSTSRTWPSKTKVSPTAYWSFTHPRTSPSENAIPSTSRRRLQG